MAGFRRKAEALKGALGQYRQVGDLTFMNLMAEAIYYSPISNRLSIDDVVVYLDDDGRCTIDGDTFVFEVFADDVWHLAKLPRQTQRKKRTRIINRK